MLRKQFLKPRIIIFKNLTMPKIGKGGPLGYLKIKFVAKYPIRLDIKKFSTKFQSRKKIERPLKNIPLVKFCKCTKTFLAEAGTRTRDHWVPPKPIGRSYNLLSNSFKICQFAGFKNKSHYYSLLFLLKRRPKTEMGILLYQ